VALTKDELKALLGKATNECKAMGKEALPIALDYLRRILANFRLADAAPTDPKMVAIMAICRMAESGFAAVNPLLAPPGPAPTPSV
jgi:hypothetical protein